MRTLIKVASAVLAVLISVTVLRAADPLPWAYAIAPPGAPAAPPAPDDGMPRQLPGSEKAFTLTQLRDAFNVADWYPGDHPSPPDIILHGKKPDVRGCGQCHYPNGKGRPENAGVSGLPYAYFMQQLIDFKNGDRKSADPRKANTNLMIAFAKGMTEEEMKQTATYFAAIKFTPWIKVKESETVPKTKLTAMFIPIEGPGAGTEPLGQRIIEVPENPEHTELLRDPHSGFIAYVPVGSIKKGEALVTNGAGKTTQCGVCHGPDLKGLGPVPALAGRSPSYIARQLYDMQQGTRKGLWSELMKPVVAKLTEEDMMAIAAYTSSRMP
jgi:cytochrome c553